MDIWEKLRRFLLFWLCVLAVLIVTAVVTYWSEIVMWTNGQIRATISLLVTIAVLIVGIGMMLRSIF